MTELILWREKQTIIGFENKEKRNDIIEVNEYEPISANSKYIQTDVN